MIVDSREKVERAIEDAFILQGWKEAPEDFDWQGMDPHDIDSPPKYDFAAVMRLMAEAEVNEKRESFKVHEKTDDFDALGIADDCQRWAARKDGTFSEGTLERMRQARDRAQGITDEPKDDDGR